MTGTVVHADAVAGAPSYTGKKLRQALGGVWTKASNRLLGATSGIHPAAPSTLVTIAGSNATVAAHTGVLDLEASAAAGPYAYTFGADEVIVLNAASATNQRVDSIFVQLNDSTEGDASTPPASCQYVYAAGTAGAAGGARGAAGGPPNFPNSRCMELVQIVVPISSGGAAVPTIVAPAAVAAGGIAPARSTTTRPANPYRGQYCDDPTFGLMRYNGAAWIPQLLVVTGTHSFPSGSIDDGQSYTFGFTYPTAPRAVIVQLTEAEPFIAQVTAITTTGYTVNMHVASGSAAGTSHSIDFTALVVA